MTKGAAPLIRRGVRNASFTAISNALIAHPTLSPEARIALIYLLSKPEDWALQIDDLRRTLGTGGKPCGRNKAYDVIRELKISAFVIAVETSAEPEKGWFGRITYYVFDEPVEDPQEFARSKGGRIPVAQAGRLKEDKATEPQKTAPVTQNRETAIRPLPQKPYPGKGHLTKERKLQKTDSPLPSPTAQSSSTANGQEGGFEKLWSEWPEAERPKAKGYAEKLLQRLTPDEQREAVRLAAGFRVHRKGIGEPALMIPYLKQRLFAELIDAPPVEVDGHFRITPDRDEWRSWVDGARRKYSSGVVEKIEKSGFILRKTRWPESSTTTRDIRPSR